MDIQPTNQQAISDDQELAKVLAGVNEEAEAATETQSPPDPVAPPTPMPSAPPTEDDASDDQGAVPEPAASDQPAPATPAQPPTPMPTGQTATTPTPQVADPALDGIKQQALGELRPLVDKLDVAPEEKFDTYLLLLRSTDDKELIAPAHEAAKAIADEARRAQALLDIIKEIDFLAGSQQQSA